MRIMNDKTHFGMISITLHWLMALLIIAAFASIEMRGLFEKGTDGRELIKTIHFLIGLSILALVMMRLAFRVLQQQPKALIDDPTQKKLVGIMHWVLYAFMVVMPVLGWLTISAEGKQLMIFGAQLPQLLAANHDLAEIFEESHEIIGQFGYMLIGLHALAGILHHYLFRDATLLRMLGKDSDDNHLSSNATSMDTDFAKTNGL